MSGSNELLKEILGLTRAMHDEASAGEWGRVQELVKIRQGLIQACFPLDNSIRDRDLAAGQIREVIGWNKEVSQLASEAKRETGLSIDTLRQGRAAARAYQDISPPTPLR